MLLITYKKIDQIALQHRFEEFLKEHREIHGGEAEYTRFLSDNFADCINIKDTRRINI